MEFGNYPIWKLVGGNTFICADVDCALEYSAQDGGWGMGVWRWCGSCFVALNYVVRTGSVYGLKRLKLKVLC